MNFGLTRLAPFTAHSSGATTFRGALVGILVASLLIVEAAAAGDSGPRSKVQNPKSSSGAAVIVVPRGSSAQRQSSAYLLQSYLERSLGYKFPIVDRPGDSLNFHVGRSTYVDSLKLLDGLDDDGFVLKLVDDQNYLIVGPTEWGTEFGVVTFLEDIVGVRWLFPGELGIDIPAKKMLALNREPIRQQPAFYSRRITGLEAPPQDEWLRRMRVHSRIEFHHNLKQLFPPSIYARTHPEFYALVGGKRRIPKNDGEYDWQPDLSAPGIVDEAAKRIIAQFRAHPEQTSYSLGINDSIDFDDSRLAGKPAPPRNFLNLRSVSDEYYAWCNAVIERVLREYPDKWFGCLAYNNVIEPPSFKLHPRLIPYICYDRLKWLDPAERTQGERLQERWQQAANQIGWYDYVYGAPYMLPRLYPHEMARYLRYAREHGVVAQKAEGYPIWADGPKLWVYLKLWWNPDLDVDALINEWCERCVGKDAAPLLHEYCDIWERFWTKTLPPTDWFRTPGQYQPFYRTKYMDYVDESDVRRSRQLLEECAAKAQTPTQRERARFLLSIFSYYEASVLSYRGSLPQTQPLIRSSDDAIAALNDAVERMTLAERRIEYLDNYKRHPILSITLDETAYRDFDGREWSRTTLWRVFDAARNDRGIHDRLVDLRKSPTRRIAENATRMLNALDAPRGRVVSVNSSFEDGRAPWLLWVDPGKGALRIVNDFGHDGKSSVLCEGVVVGGPNQEINVTPGRYLARCQIYADDNCPPGAYVGLVAVLRGADNQNLPTPDTIIRPVPGKWTEAACALDVPRDPFWGTTVTHVLLIANVRNCPGGKIWIDELSLERQ